ncbi:tetratricopeptide repeat protein [Fredinandcohnia onubensis]|uniref:tetratricopeptide repeat protein n=1 Tax=Fredinandcohnia onubensis TaxID=1571209 RepID=UPI000C0BF25A|nr:tetratricopeptide repeat protein [Fredinandcohnia onubensis]
MPGHQINPRFIQALTGRDIDSIPSSPLYSDVKGKYVSLIQKNKLEVVPIYQKNEFMLKCKNCGRKGKYYVGLLIVNPDREKVGHSDYIQFSGYFRCKHCNAAGNWEESTEIKISIMSSLISPNMLQNRIQIGVNRLFDGTSHTYSTDAEEHLLQKIEEDPESSFLWNRLGNLYVGGARPELAVAAFEKSLSIDPDQTESHYSLGSLLEEVNDNENAAYHFRQVLLTAESYKELDAVKLRDLVASGIRLAFLIHLESDGEIPFIPSEEEMVAFGKDVSQLGSGENLNLETFSEDLTSFFPLAEMYLGKRKTEIPKWEQALKPSVKKVKKKKKKRK